LVEPQLTIKRRKPLKRSALKRKPAKAKPWALPAYRVWVRAQPCLCCTAQRTVTDAAHVVSRGAGGQDAGNLVPLCRYHHAAQHHWGMTTFQARYHVNLKAWAAVLWEEYQAKKGGA